MTGSVIPACFDSLPLTVLVLFLLSLTLRVLVSCRIKPGFDVYGHLCFAATLKEQRRGPFGSIKMRIVGASDYSQPFLWHWLVGFLDAKAILRNQAWLNAVIDSLFTVIAFLVIRISGYSEAVALYSAAIYLLSPMWFSSVAIGPRIAGFTPRLSSEVMTNLFFLVCLLPVDLTKLQVVILGGVLAAFVLSSSKFGVQALLFLTPLVALTGGGILPLISLVAGLVLAVTTSRGRILSQLKSQVLHLVWYCKENLKGKMHVSSRNSFRALFRMSEGSLKGNMVRLLHGLVSENSYTSVIIKLPVTMLVIFALLEESIQGNLSPASPLVAPILSAAIVYFTVNLRPFLFLGEAERYFNHVAFFLAVFAAQYALKNNLEWLLWVLLIYGFLYWGLEALLLHKLTPAHLLQRFSDDNRLIQDLQTLANPTVVLGYPYQVAGGVFRVILETKHLAVYCLCTEKNFSERFNSRYATDYPYIKLEKLEEMADEYGIGYIILDRRAKSSRGYENWKPSSRWVEREVGGETYDVYYRPDLPEQMVCLP